MREWIVRLVDWFRRDTLERELAEELRFHRQQLERGVERSFLDANDIVREAEEMLCDAVAVHRLDAQRLEDEHVEHAGQQVASRSRHGQG